MVNSKYHGIFLFLSCFGMVLFFQNCSDSGQPSRSSANNNQGSQDIINPDDTDKNNDPNSFGFRIGPGGDAFSYLKGPLDAELAPNQSVRISYNVGGLLSTTNLFYDAETEMDPATTLPLSYCKNSILATCRAQSTIPCQGADCSSEVEVQCSQSKKLSQSAANDLITTAAQLVVSEKKEAPTSSDCDTPNLAFESPNKNTLFASLGNSNCVPVGKNYAQEGAQEIITSFDTFFNDINKDNLECNLFSRYQYQSTNFTYVAASGFTTPENSYYYKVESLGTRANIEFRRGADGQNLCASQVSISELDAFFPPEGLKYSVLKTEGIIVDGSTGSITYRDNDYGANGEARFHLRSIGAQSERGGAYMSLEQATAMEAAVSAIILRAQELSLVSPCTP